MIKYPGQKSIFPIKNGVNLCRLIREIQTCAYFWTEAARSMKYQFWPHLIVELKQCALVVDRTPDFETRPEPGPGLKKAGPSGQVPGLY